MIDHFDVILVVQPPDDEAHRAAVVRQQQVADAFEFLAAVIDARFAVIRAGLDMTRKVINDG